MKRIIHTILIVTLLLQGCSLEQKPVDVIVDSYALAYLAEEIATDDIVVLNINEATEQELDRSKQLVNEAKLIMYVYEDDNYEISAIKNSVNIFEKLHTTIDDRNFWLSPKEMIVASEVVYQTMLNTFPNKKDELLSNYNKLLDSLEELDLEYKNVSDNAKRSEFIITYDDFKYLSQYGIETKVYVDEEEELNDINSYSNHDREFIDLINDENIDYIANTTNGDGSEYKSLINSVDVEELTLNVLDKKPETGDYITAQYRNIISIDQLLN